MRASASSRSTRGISARKCTKTRSPVRTSAIVRSPKSRCPSGPGSRAKIRCASRASGSTPKARSGRCPHEATGTRVRTTERTLRLHAGRNGARRPGCGASPRHLSYGTPARSLLGSTDVLFHWGPARRERECDTGGEPRRPWALGDVHARPEYAIRGRPVARRASVGPGAPRSDADRGGRGGPCGCGDRSGCRAVPRDPAALVHHVGPTPGADSGARGNADPLRIRLEDLAPRCVSEFVVSHPRPCGDAFRGAPDYAENSQGPRSRGDSVLVGPPPFGRQHPV